MIIHSTFKDYYDGVTAQHRDTTIHWQRESKSFHANGLDIPNEIFDIIKHFRFMDVAGTNYTIGICGFCGFYYPYLKINNLGDCKIYEWDISKIVDTMCSLKQTNFMLFGYNYKLKNKQLFELLTNISQTRMDSEFIKHKTPIINVVFSYGKNPTLVVLNKRLQDIQFYKLKDAYTTANELSDYYGTVLTQVPEIPEPDNKTKIKSAGFDLKKSFRKKPTKTHNN